MGKGRGGLAQEKQTKINFKTERGKVHTGKGAIIGQFQVDGEQLKGDVSGDLVELLSAAERDASDRISRDRIPRQYQKAVKAYFSSVRRSLKNAPAKDGDEKSKDADRTKTDSKTEKEAAGAPAHDEQED